MHPFRRISKNPRSNIIRIGNREIVTQGLNSGFWTDLYHRSMTVSWPLFFASAALVFIALNGTFAAQSAAVAASTDPDGRRDKHERTRKQR